MRIAVDGRHLLAGRGVARVTRSLLQALAAGPAAGDELVAVVPGRTPLAEALPGAELVRTAFGSRALHGTAALARRPRLDRLAGGADVVWLPAPAPVAVSRTTPYVLTVHDRSWEQRPGDFTAYERLWHRAARPRTLAARAARVTTDSAWVAADLRAAWGVGDVRVVRPGAGLVPRPGAAGARAPVPAGSRPYFLAVGALEPRKAPEVLARAWTRARAAGLDADLAVVGSGRAEAALRDAPGVELVGAVGDGVLDVLYDGAVALVHPARLEGFGLPPLEAALRGVPTVGSDLPPLRETLGDAALLVAPGDDAALAEAIGRIAADRPLRDRLGAAARERAAALSWERAARELHALLREAADA